MYVKITLLFFFLFANTHKHPYPTLATTTTTTSSMAEPPPKYSAEKLGEYTVIADIAEGTFGKVKSTQTTKNAYCLGSCFGDQWPHTRLQATKSP